ncbi:NfeD family protein [Thermococcus stetteri]|uniref:NfeD family protein n=1 Tax=Thermococcus stetteri TaxID=49900 RepID=UPI001AE19E49|nr:NfeD family protein [Thermococcus stetteri]
MNLGRIARLLLLSADELVVGVFLLLILPSLGIKVPLAVTVPLLAFLIIKDLLVAPYVLKGGLERRPLTGPEALMGLEVVVVEDLAPEGIVRVGNELWRGVCINGKAKRGEKVRVVGFRGNLLLLERQES